MKRSRSYDKICQRRSDNTLYRPSCPDDYNAGQAFADIFSKGPCWYFRRIRRVKCKLRPNFWQDTGEVWKPKEGKEFRVLSNSEALEIL